MALNKEQAREVVARKSLRAMIDDGTHSFGLNPSAPMIVREHLDKSWTVEYPEEGFIPARPNQERPYVVSHWPLNTPDDPRSLDAAQAYAEWLCEGRRTIKVVNLSVRTRNSNIARGRIEE